MRQTKETSGLVLVVEDNRNISEMIGEYRKVAASKSTMHRTARMATALRRRTAMTSWCST